MIYPILSNYALVKWQYMGETGEEIIFADANDQLSGIEIIHRFTVDEVLAILRTNQARNRLKQRLHAVMYNTQPASIHKLKP